MTAAAEQLVAQGAADEPALRARKRLAQPVGEIIHRRIRAWLVSGEDRMPVVIS